MTERRSVWFQRNLFVVAKKMGKLEKEAYLEINKADLRLGTNTGGSSATPRDWVTSPAPGRINSMLVSSNSSD